MVNNINVVFLQQKMWSSSFSSTEDVEFFVSFNIRCEILGFFNRRCEILRFLQQKKRNSWFSSTEDVEFFVFFNRRCGVLCFVINNLVNILRR